MFNRRTEYELSGKVAVITGAGGGIGGGIAKKLSAAGAKVIINDVDEVSIERMIKEIKKIGGECFGKKADVSKAKEVKALIDAIRTDGWQSHLSEVCYRFNRRFWEREAFDRLLVACASTSTITCDQLMGKVSDELST